MPNHLHYGDNLTVLRESIRDESVDLIYLDPPFNSNAGYNVLFKAPDGSGSAAQIEALDDTWHWNDSAESAFADVLRSDNSAAAEMLQTVDEAVEQLRLKYLHVKQGKTGMIDRPMAYLDTSVVAKWYLAIDW